MRILKYLLTLTIFCMHLMFSQEPIKPPLISSTPLIDGILNDEIWKEVPSYPDFKTYAPDWGKTISENTKVYIAYDEENLYFAFHCFDKEPQKIKSSITNRDKIDTDDWICINLDSFNDHQSLYAFYVNALGIQMDSRFTAGNEDISMDFIWYSGAVIDSSGYTVEVQIPLKSIRYSDKNPVEMAVIFERNISRKSERGTFPPLDPQKGMGAFLTMMKPLLYSNLKPYTLFEILPSVTYARKYSLEKNDLNLKEDKGNLSLTTKYGITSDLILDATYNPDFSQVESDAGQIDINLRYELYYPEKRSFFLEGGENFKLGAVSSYELEPISTLVNTRTIIDPLVGVKLSGKISEKNTISSIYAMDELETEGKYAHSPVIRYKRTLDNDSYFGAIYTGREFDGSFNRVYGIDGIFRITKSGLLESFILNSNSKPPDKSESINGHALGLLYHNDSRELFYYVNVKDLSTDFQTQTGYLYRNGITMFSGFLRQKFYPGTNLFRNIYLEFFTGQTNDKYYHMWETSNYFAVQAFLWGATSLKLKYSYSTEIYNGERFKTGGFHALLNSTVSAFFQTGILYRAIKAIYYSSSPYQGHSNNLTASFVLLPTDKFHTNIDLTYSNFYRDSDSKKIYDYLILRGKLTYQFNKYLFLRGIVEHNSYRKELLTDFLISFTYIPGTVLHTGYGSFYEKIKWIENEYYYTDKFLETRRGFFFKASYLWRS